MPQEIKDIKKFLEYARRKDATSARIKVSKKSRKDAKTGLTSTVNQTKFKLRCSKYMYTLVMDDATKAEKLRQSLPPTLQVQDIDKDNKANKKK
ncbi:60S ribosomal protein L38 [Cystobasidium minutum MCA 4210]|uniref:60S ribosomal protein eL38 n=1 Tax=Cystobasidium minutum MCA 4210 TaxID=1397322 RepID=UPI0034CD6F3A|eukprot:jgi/Rhomi1/154154/estExt_Genewise1.C_5_t20173